MILCRFAQTVGMRWLRGTGSVAFAGRNWAKKNPNRVQDIMHGQR